MRVADGRVYKLLGLGTGESTNCGGGGRDSLLIVGVADGIVN